MGDPLQQILKSLCLKTQWKYAVFWKLKRRARMVLTWEDAYYDNHEPYDSVNLLGNLCPTETHNNVHGIHYMGDALGLAVAKMSYLVYSLGEGIIGQVAFTGKHRWIFADEPASISLSSTELQHLDGWQSQFSAGIKTVAVVAVEPHGVVQLGSSDLVAEDLMLVSHVKDIFSSLQSSSTTFLSDYRISDMFPQVRSILDEPEVSNDCAHGLDEEVSKVQPILQSHLLPYSGETSELDSAKSGNPTSEIQKKVQLKFKVQKSGLEKSLDTEMPGGAHFDIRPSYDVCSRYIDWSVVGQPFDTCNTSHYSLLHVFDPTNQCEVESSRVASHQGEKKWLPQPLKMQLSNYSGKILENHGSESSIDIMNSPFKFSVGCELHEALGSCFKKDQDSCIWNDSGSEETEAIVEAPDGVLSSLFSGLDNSEHLLEAVVANAYTSTGKITSETSLCTSTNSLLTTESLLHNLKHNKHGNDSFQSHATVAQEDTDQPISSIEGPSELLTARSSNEAPSNNQIMYSSLPDRYPGPVKFGRKRAKPGESCRPRPRDRQLIQDRLKELREIVPNGSKCSIDMLLERTIKHMLFLESVTSQAEHLKKCAESKERCIREHGTSWALEIGTHSNNFPIVVENLNMDGQMLVEILCEECSLFFKIAEVIRSLGFMILKGVTESRSGKTWACFVVEGQENGRSQRMEMLFSLMQLCQAEAMN